MSSGQHAEFLSATLPSMDLVYNLARRLAESPNDVEDLVQETYLRAYGAWVAGRRPRTPAPWIATICLNTGRSMIRRARPEVLMEDVDAGDLDEPGIPVDDEVVDAAIASLDRRLVREALLRLSEEQRVAIALMDLAGFTASEAARITGSPRGTILARVHRGRKRLAGMLERSVMLDEES